MVDETGLTVRVTGLVETLLVTASDQTTVQGPVPVRAASIPAKPPLQMVPSPLTYAVGSPVTVTVTLAVFWQPFVSVPVTV